MTYSIIAFDPGSGVYGAAVQSHWFNVAQIVPWVRFGVGSVVTQGHADPSYGWRGLEAMAGGMDSRSALKVLLAADADAERRQVAFIDKTGGVSVHTGERCVRYASHHVGDGWAVLGNLLSTDKVIPTMAEVFASSEGTLPGRMVAALEAAEEQGGDLRGAQSAALRISSSADFDLETGVDISVADHPDPIGELKRLLAIDEAYRALGQADTALDAGDRAAAISHLGHVGSLADRVELEFWRGIALARMGRLSDARHSLDEVFRRSPRFREVLIRLAEVDPEIEHLLTFELGA
jgi:uncharacterized Ntn-hydrolase superfamily protein